MGDRVVLYVANPSTPAIRAAIDRGVLACMTRPGQGNRVSPGWVWAVDNGCFGAAGFKPSRWLVHLERHAGMAEDCLFAAVPDRLGDFLETMRLWEVWTPVVRELGYRPAFVVQDGQPSDMVPWDDLLLGTGALFMGGTTDYKLGPEAHRLAVQARARGVWVHWGRVNSRRRFAMAALDGDSADGRFLTFGPDRNLPELLGWLNTLPFEVTP